ncbi:hypothetical protein R1flu_027077 [Riccia fluitans]|uniref:Uncharacterized protein n=1 Tax=Riccia fluitans TaxID=41844 RepID=A0ABD1XIC6_9MARC
MSGIRQRSSRKSNVPPEERPSQCRRCATSPNYELPHDEAMETIDQIVQGEEINSRVGAIVEKISTLYLFARSVAGPQGQLPTNVSREGLKEYLVFPNSEDSSRVVSASIIEISLRLNHTKEDRASTAKFREGWQAVVQLLRTKFLATQMARQNQEDPLLLGDEPRNAFGDTKAQWDVERCELVRERDQLKEDLLKAQDVLADTAQRKEAL